MAPFDFYQTEDDLMNGLPFIGMKSWPIDLLDFSTTTDASGPDLSTQKAKRNLLTRALVVRIEAPALIRVPTKTKLAYPLDDAARIVAPDVHLIRASSHVSSHAYYVTSMRTPSYAEHLLQILDKNAAMTSVVVLVAYAVLLTSL